MILHKALGAGALILLLVLAQACSGSDSVSPITPVSTPTSLAPSPAPSVSPTPVPYQIPPEPDLPNGVLDALEDFANQQGQAFSRRSCADLQRSGVELSLDMCYLGVRQQEKELRVRLGRLKSDFGWTLTLQIKADIKADDAYEIVNVEQPSP
jgi:hypothetical protein